MDESPDNAAPPKLRPHDVPYRPFGDDTSPEVERFLLDAYRRMPIAEKVTRVRALNRATLNLALADIRRHHPDADEREMLLRLAVRRYGAEFARQNLGWDVDREGY